MTLIELVEASATRPLPLDQKNHALGLREPLGKLMLSVGKEVIAEAQTQIEIHKAVQAKISERTVREPADAD